MKRCSRSAGSVPTQFAGQSVLQLFYTIRENALCSSLHDHSWLYACRVRSTSQTEGTCVTAESDLGGQVQPTASRSYTKLINEALGLKGIKWEYHSAHRLKEDSEWLYLKLTGGPYCTVKRPCFAWIGPGYSISTAKPMKYLGIFRGPPPDKPHDMVEYIGGSPANIHDDDLSQRQWETIRDNFSKKKKKIPGVPVPKSTFPAALDRWSTLGRKRCHRMAAQRHRDPIPQSDTRLKRRRAITYRGAPKSVTSPEPVYFEFIGGDLGCTKETPCYGCAGKGDSSSVYISIGKPGTKPGEQWEHIGAYPDAEGGTHPQWSADFEKKINSMLGARTLSKIAEKYVQKPQ
ncbi:hypothetical protein BDP27DRAFT_1495660 [Rhodocollybia butyracea]|uniref:Uncharacterized protein n=1 Tax=Rhodocollybia butyracea TaxID=206335 RepID=A0A9P5Q1X2_9AGAR|nr:hypothetical protein BDP27DRAFT_1495660 [Rhodocollybia butyracea]